MPWPVTGRDVVIHVTTEKTADGTVIRHLKADPTYIPEEKGQIRVPKLVGEWKLQPKGQGVTEVTYQVETEPGGSIPSWLANSFVVDAPLNTLRACVALPRSAERAFLAKDRLRGGFCVRRKGAGTKRLPKQLSRRA